nr:MAG TPA: hypothetical protein [Caudoviricetes sp.]
MESPYYSSIIYIYNHQKYAIIEVKNHIYYYS